MARVSLFTLGCRLNQFESDSIAGQLEDRGHEVVRFGEACDVAVVNSCTVTARADRKSRQAVYRALDNAKTVIVTGCYADNPERLLPEDPRITPVSNTKKAAIPYLVGEVAPGTGDGGSGAGVAPGAATSEAETPAAGANSLWFPPPVAGVRSRGMVKVQDGCDQVCAYCIVSRVRGPSRSIPLSQVLSQVSELLNGGYREIVLTGVNVGDYRDGKNHLADLVAEILAISGDFRLRITSLEPDHLGPGLVKQFENPRLCPHLHLALQSGSDSVLHAMKRGYKTSEVRRQVADLRNIDPLFNITADLIVGFPGESQADFEESVALVTAMEMGHVHVFPFSQRPGTAAGSPAFSRPQLPGPEIRRRSATLRRAAGESALTYRQRLIGTVEEVIVESRGKDGLSEGYGRHYCRIRTDEASSTAPGTPVTVRVTGIDRDGVLRGTLVDAPRPKRGPPAQPQRGG